MKTRTPATKWQWNLFYSKVITRSVNTFIPLRDETINSSLVERCRSLMDPQPHPIMHYLVRIKPTSTNVFLQVTTTVEVTSGKIWDVRRILKCSQISEAYPSPNWQYGDGLYHAKGWFRPTESQDVFTLWRVAASSAPRNEPHLSALLCLPPVPMLDEHNLNYTHLQSNKETIVWTCAFSLSMFPTLQMAVSIHNNRVASFARNVFYRRC